MFRFWAKKEDPAKRLYPSFQSRIFAALVDTALAIFILIPIFSITSSAIYGDNLPSKRLEVIMNRVQKQINNSAELSKKLSRDPQYQKFIAQHGYRGLMIEQGIQTSLFAVAIFVFWLKKRSTPGKMFLSMKIVDAKTLKDPSVTQLVIRLCSYALSILPLGMGIFYIAFHKKHRAWHDILSGTLVVTEIELKRQLLAAKN